MFRQIRLLTGTGIGNILGSFKSIKGKNKRKKYAMICLFAFLGVYMAFISGGLTGVIYTKLFDKPETEELKVFIPCLFFVAASALTLITGIFSSQGFLFKSNDFDMLFSFPVSTKAILISKFIIFYLYELIFSVITIGVSSVVFMVLDGVTVSGILTTVVGVFLTPLLPMLVGSLIAYGISLLIRNSSHKNQITTILTVVASVGLFVVLELTAFSSENFVAYLIKNGGDILKSFRDYYFPAGWYLSAFSGSFGYLLAFILLNLLPLAVLLVIEKNYRSLVASFRSGGKKVKFTYSETNSSKKSMLFTCFAKEAKRLFSSSVYLMNSGMGIVMMFIMLIPLSDVGKESSIAVTYILTAEMLFMSTVASTTMSTISLEAKTLWIYKSSPVNEKTVLTSKAMLNYTLFIPAIIVVSIIAKIMFGLTLAQMAVVILVPAVAVLASSYYGLVINLALPKFDWANETQAIKQSSSVFAAMFSLMLFNMTFIGGSVYLIISKHANPDLLVGIVFLVYLALYAVAKRLTNTWGVRKFRSL